MALAVVFRADFGVNSTFRISRGTYAPNSYGRRVQPALISPSAKCKVAESHVGSPTPLVCYHRVVCLFLVGL